MVSPLKKLTCLEFYLWEIYVFRSMCLHLKADLTEDKPGIHILTPATYIRKMHCCTLPLSLWTVYELYLPPTQSEDVFPPFSRKYTTLTVLFFIFVIQTTACVYFLGPITVFERVFEVLTPLFFAPTTWWQNVLVPRDLCVRVSGRPWE